jgi:drug/metabolite transporter (DMT)-like permease
MDYLLLLCTAFTGASLSLFSSFFEKKNNGKKDTTQIYNLIMIAAVVFGWGAYWIFEGGFNVKVIPYSLLFGVGYAGAVIGLINAIKTGPVSLSNLFLQLSLIATTIWGFGFWGDTPTVLTWIGIALVVLALTFCLYQKKGAEEKGISVKWVIFAAIGFAGNGMAAIVARTQQMDFDGILRGQFMTMATAFALVISIIMYVLSDKRDTKAIIKTAGYVPALAGIINVIHNLIVLVLAVSPISPSLVYPVISVGGIIIVALFSFFFMKEKISLIQWIGIALGAAATVLLSI